MSKAVQSSLAMVPVKVVLFGQIAPLERATPIHIPPLNDRACFDIFFHTLTILGHYHVFNLYQLAKQKIRSLCCCNLHLFEDCCRLNSSSKCISPLCLSFGVVRSCLQSVFRASAHLMNLQERSENSESVTFCYNVSSQLSASGILKYMAGLLSLSSFLLLLYQQSLHISVLCDLLELHDSK